MDMLEVPRELLYKMECVTKCWKSHVSSLIRALSLVTYSSEGLVSLFPIFPMMHGWHQLDEQPAESNISIPDASFSTLQG